MEILYNSLIELQNSNKISINPRLKNLLTAESTKHRNPTTNFNLLPPELKNAAKSLKADDSIVIRRADKSSIYVLLDKDEYINKINSILQDEAKFKKLDRDPTQEIKKRANDLISTLNAVANNCNITKITGHFTAGYIYGNPKIHKPNNPLRPIISQVPTPTYQLAKSLNSIISPYIPNRYSINSTNQFIDLLHSHNGEGIMASLDVESLFTNVPISDTINIISDYMYRNPDKHPPQIPETILRSMLELCTSKSPFLSPSGQYYQQVDGVAMGSPLGPTFANFYMGHLENKVFNEHLNKPIIYARYVDDIFLLVDDLQYIDNLKRSFEENSVLKFTFEMNSNFKIPFLDILIDNSDNTFKTVVYRKPTDHGQCLNYNSNCPTKYKKSVITNYLHRAFKVSSTWSNFHNEVEYIKQMLINNNYPNYLVDSEINRFLNKKLSPNPNDEINKTPLNVYYSNQMHTNYKLEERTIKSIINDNIICNDNYTVNIIFYYKNLRSSNLVIKNAPHFSLNDSEKHNLIYCFKCPSDHAQPTFYVGKTTTTLNQRMSQHKSIQDHMSKYHNIKSTKLDRLKNTTIIARENNRNRLSIKEALYIRHASPEINKQDDNFQRTLKLNPERIINLSEISKPFHEPRSYNSSEVQTSLSQSSLGSSESLIASSSQPSPQTTLITQPNVPAQFSDILITNQVSPNIQQRINQYLSNSQRHTYTETQQNTPPIRRRNLRPRAYLIDYRE